MTLGSLFDGIGGWLLASRHAGVTPIWSSEIEAFPCAVTKRHFPEVVQLGDITKLNGAELSPVDIVCAGSPCQDLSIAGTRKGLDGARSGLFRVAVELVRDMRRATDGRYPRFFVWENVPGAFSSNKGADFRAVLEEIGQTEIPIPKNGKWANAGMAELPQCEIAWRTLDAQYWGVPQRRRRIFLVADFTAGKRCAAEVLFEPEGYSGDTTAGKETGKGAAGGIDSGTKAAGGAYGFDTKASIADNASVLSETTPTLRTNTRLGVYDMTHADEVMRPVLGGVMPTLNARMGTGGNQVPVVHCIGDGQVNQIGLHEKTGALTCRHDQQAVVCYNICSYASNGMKSNNPHSGVYKTDTTRTLDLNGGSPVCNQGGTMVVGNSTVRRLTPLELDEYLQEVDVYEAKEGVKALFVLRENHGTEKTLEWCFAIVERIQQAEILQQGLHENGVSAKTAHGKKLDDDTLPCEEYIAEWLLRDVWKQSNGRCSPQRWESAEQFVRKLNEGVQKLSHENTPSQKEMCDMRKSAEGTWLLRETFTAIQEIWESIYCKKERSHRSVRRLTPLEAERLQGLPDGYTEGGSDTARYKALGNGMAQPCAMYIIKRIVEVVSNGRMEKCSD